MRRDPFNRRIRIGYPLLLRRPLVLWPNRSPAMRAWVIPVGLAVTDQGALSGANFVLGVLLARWLTPAAYGEYAIAFSIFLFLSALHNALIVEPMTVLGASQTSGSRAGYVGSLIWFHIGLTGGLSLATGIGAFLLTSQGLQQSILWMAAAMPLTLLFWLVRRMHYLEVRAQQAAVASATYAIALIASALVLHRMNWLSPGTAMVAMGVAGFLACLRSFTKLRIHMGGPRSARIGEVLLTARTHLGYGRWMAATDVFTLGSTQVQTFAVAWMLGLGAAGVLRAMQAFTLPMVQVSTAVGSLALPILSAVYAGEGLAALQRKGHLVTFLLGGLAVMYSLVLIAFGGPLEHLLYGGKFADSVWLIGILAGLALFGAIAQGLSLSLRALRRPRYYLVVGLIPSMAGLAAAVPLIYLWGIGGAAASIVFTAAASCATNFWLYRRWVLVA